MYLILYNRIYIFHLYLFSGLFVYYISLFGTSYYVIIKIICIYFDDMILLYIGVIYLIYVHNYIIYIYIYIYQ